MHPWSRNIYKQLLLYQFFDIECAIEIYAKIVPGDGSR